jgi:hypothetical protein
LSTDSDGDLISISSAEELITALNEQKTEVLKLCVTVQGGPYNPPSKSMGRHVFLSGTLSVLSGGTVILLTTSHY